MILPLKDFNPETDSAFPIFCKKESFEKLMEGEALSLKLQYKDKFALLLAVLLIVDL